jgi:DNA-binding protein H-NS
MTLNELIKTKGQIESAIYSLLQAEQSRLLQKAMSGVEGKMLKSARRNKQARQGHPLKGRKLPVRFRNPANRRETWAGRGHKPRWLVAALKRRSSKLADFAVE